MKDYRTQTRDDKTCHVFLLFRFHQSKVVAASSAREAFRGRPGMAGPFLHHTASSQPAEAATAPSIRLKTAAVFCRRAMFGGHHRSLWELESKKRAKPHQLRTKAALQEIRGRDGAPQITHIAVLSLPIGSDEHQWISGFLRQGGGWTC